MATITIKRSL